MLLDTYQEQERFWLTTLFGAPSSMSGTQAFRGEFVVLEGEFKETAGKRNPPKAVIKQAVMLADDSKLHMVAGNFSSVEELPMFVDLFHKDLAADCTPIFFIDNLAESSVVEIEGTRYILVLYKDGTVWNELMDMGYLDKTDLKGQSSEDKVVTVFEGCKNFKCSFPQHTLEEVLASKTDAKRAVWGAI